MKVFTGVTLFLSLGSFHAGAATPGYLLEWTVEGGQTNQYTTQIQTSTNAIYSDDQKYAVLFYWLDIFPFLSNALSIQWNIYNMIQVTGDMLTNWTMLATVESGTGLNQFALSNTDPKQFFRIMAYVPAWKPSVTLAWTASPDAAVNKYRLYWGGQSGRYTNYVETPNLQAGVSNLNAGSTYVFSATALSTNGLESDYSKELLWTAPTNQPPLRIEAGIRRL